jgi:hypothetical protein
MTDDARPLDPSDHGEDVRALAALIADPALRPPLAVGVFGPDAAATTAFLQRIEHELDSGGGVIHVRFDAWHHADSRPHAALLEEILVEVGEHLADRAAVAAVLHTLGDGATRLAEARAHEDDVKQRRAAVQAELDAANAAASKAREEARAHARREAATQVAIELAFAKPGKDKDESEGKDEDKDEDKDDDDDDDREGHERVEREHAAMSSALGFLKGFRKSWPHVSAALAVVILTVLLFLAVKHVAAWLGGAAGLFGVLSSYYAAVKKTGTTWRQRVAERVAEAPAVRAADERIEAIEAKLQIIERQLFDAEGAAEAAAAAVERATLRSLIAGFVTERLGAGASPGERGSVARIRDALARLEPALRAAEVSADKAVRRIVVCVDGLDRCAPATVVEVLQAVHQLLALHPFVAVVGVDAAWALRAIKHHCPWLSEPGEPEAYLERLFQLVLWLDGAGEHAGRAAEAADAPAPPASQRIIDAYRAALGGDGAADEPRRRVPRIARFTLKEPGRRR